MIWTPVTRTVSALASLVIVGSGLLAGHLLSDSASQRALAAGLRAGKSSAPRMLVQVGAVPDELKESSGLAISRTQPGVLWSHNDSGDGPRLYAIDISGKLLGVFRVNGATARDWEDISSGPCPAETPTPAPTGKSACLFIADTGDNDQVRPDVSIYIVVEPRVGDAGAEASVTARALRYRYPSGPTDAEALGVRPNGDLTIVSKGRSGTIDFYSIPAESVTKAIASSEIITAIFAGNTGIQPDPRIGRLVTAAAVSPDGMTLAVRTYYEVYFFKLVTRRGQTRWEDIGESCSLGDAEPQGEAIDYLDSKTLLLGSERARGRPGSIHRLQC
jgi:hypothetical protein